MAKVDDVVREVSRITVDRNGMTTAEIMQETGFSCLRVRRELSIALKRGLIRVGRKAITDLAGRQTTSPAYFPVEKKK